MAEEKCCAPGCDQVADVEVRLYDVYLHGSEAEIFDERDYTCPFLCAAHVCENEMKAEGERRPRGGVVYPFSNRNVAQGFTIYRPLKANGD